MQVDRVILSDAVCMCSNINLVLNTALMFLMSLQDSIYVYLNGPEFSCLWTWP